MKRNFLCLIAVIFCIAAIVPDAGALDPAPAEETEILKITVGEATLLDPRVFQNTAGLAASRTGVVAVFYRLGPRQIKKYRISQDGGLTWGKPMDAPPISGGAQRVALRDGGVIKLNCEPIPIEGKPGWYDEKTYKFTDNFESHERFTAKLYMPNHQISGDVTHPGMAKGPIIQLPNGDLLMPMYGGLKGDKPDIRRSYLVRSTDLGRTWSYYSSINYIPEDPNPELPGQYVGSGEPSITLLPNGQMLAMLRNQNAHWPGEYKPMYVAWSDDLGKTWTKPTLTNPHLMSIQPTLQVLDNGVVACEYGRPGLHVAFSLDNGRTWQDRVSFSDLPTPPLTGQYDMAKVGPNKLVVVGNDAEGTKVWPITVERVTVSPARVTLTGWVLARQGGPDPDPLAGAKVELSPNRYALDSWLEDSEVLDVWKAAPKTIGSPKSSYLSIRKENGHPTVQTDAKGDFSFDNVKLGEYVLTVEAEGYAPQYRHIKVGPEAKPHEFRLKAGRKVWNRVVDDKGKPVAGACVVLNNWHMHTDAQGFFNWSVKDPLPEQVSVKAYKRYGKGGVRGVSLEQHYTVPFSQIEREPIILRQ